MNQTKIAILASGSGSTAEAFIRDIQMHHLPLEVVLVISNNPDAFVFERVLRLQHECELTIATAVINSHTQPAETAPVHGHQTDEEQAAILTLLRENAIDLVLLLGYMKLVGPKLLAEYGFEPNYTSIYQCHMLNTHPGLLPDTVGTHGLGTQKYVLAQGMSEAGQTLHVVSAKYDQGPTVAEHRVPVAPGDTAETLFDRVQTAEKAHIAHDVMNFVQAQQKYQEEV